MRKVRTLSLLVVGLIVSACGGGGGGGGNPPPPDTTPPNTSITGSPSDPTNLADASFVFTSSEANSTFECSIDAAAFATCASPADFAGLAEGAHVFSVRATDAAGNTDATPATYDWTIDLTAPVVTVPAGKTVGVPDASGAAAADPAIQAFLSGATASDNVDGDLTGSLTNDAPAIFPVGITTVTFSVTDAAGNTGSNSSTVDVVIVDSEPPDTTSIIINNNVVYAVSLNEFTARLTALDNIGVTGYLITEHNATDPMNIIPAYLDPLISDGGWVAVAETTALDITIQVPVTQTHNLGDTVELCAWFRDAAGNISARVCDAIIYGVDWESGQGFWSADNGVWQVGTPSVVGPASCFSGTQCAGTVLDGDHPKNTDSRLISASVQMPTVAGADEIHLRFQQWFSYGSTAGGTVQISVWDPGTSTWGSWISEGAAINNSSGGWSLKDVDLTAYSGETVRIALFHTASGLTPGFGWYADDISIAQTSPAFTGDFESGWRDWGADNGVWQIGTPSVVGPASCFSGTQCAGTVLDGDHPKNTDSHLISASVQMPTVAGADEIHLRFQQWFSYGSTAGGTVQISVWDPGTSTWGSWISEGAAINNSSGGWSLKDVDLTTYSGETVRIALFHTASGLTPGFGWYADDITIAVF